MGKLPTQRSRSGEGPAGQRSRRLHGQVAASLGRCGGPQLSFRCPCEENQDSIELGGRGGKGFIHNKNKHERFGLVKKQLISEDPAPKYTYTRKNVLCDTIVDVTYNSMYIRKCMYTTVRIT